MYEVGAHLGGGHVWHHHDVRDVLLARELPLLDERVVHRPLEHDRRGEVVEAADDADVGELVAEVHGRLEAALDGRLDAVEPFGAQRVPHVQRRVAVARAADGVAQLAVSSSTRDGRQGGGSMPVGLPHDGGVDGVEVVDARLNA